MEAEPVRRDIEPAMEKEVSLEGTGTHWEVTGERMATRKVNSEKPQVRTLFPLHLSSDSPVPTPSPVYPTSTQRVLLRIPSVPLHPTRLLDVSSFSIAHKAEQLPVQVSSPRFLLPQEEALPCPEKRI